MDTKTIRIIFLSLFWVLIQSHNAWADYVDRNGYQYIVNQKPGVMVEYEATQIGRTSSNEETWTVGGEWMHNGATCTVTTLDIDANRNSEKQYRCKYLYANSPYFTTLKKFDVNGVEQIILGYDDPLLRNRGYLTVCEGALENTSSNIKVITVNNTVSQISSKAFFGMKDGMIKCTSTIPPFLASDAFCDEAYENITLCVPDAKISEYKNSNWGKFKKIISDMAYNIPKLNDTWVNLMIGDMTQLTLTEPIPEEYLEWKSYNDSIATVNNGRVYAHASGRVIISVTNILNEIEASAIVEVRAPYNSIEIDYSGNGSNKPDDPGINIQDYFLKDGTFQLLKGDHCQINIIKDPNQILYESLNWKSQNTKVADVDQNGNVTAISEGETKIIISTSSGVSKEVPVIVTNYFFYDHIKYIVPETPEEVVGTKTAYPSMGKDEDDFLSVRLIGDIALPANPKSISQTFTLTTLPVGCFSNQWSIKSIKIPNTVNTIEFKAFESCSSLVSVELPESLQSIGENIFENCTSLVSAKLPNGITSIPYKTFYGCSNLKNCEIPTSVTTIGARAFENCKQLNDIEIPNSVTSLGSNAFANCSELTHIAIPNSVNSIGSKAFYGCTNLENIEIEDGTEPLVFEYEMPNVYPYTFSLTFVKNLYLGRNFHAELESPFKGLDLSSVTIGNNVTTLPAYAFAECKKLVSVKISNSVVKIGNYAFTRCESLEDIEIPNSVEELGSGVFSDCKSLSSLIIPPSITKCGGFPGITKIAYPSHLASNVNYQYLGWVEYDPDETIIEDGVVYSKDKSSILFVKSSIEGDFKIQPSVVTIKKAAFYSCYKITSVEIPNSVTSIYENAFSLCEGLVSINIPESVKTIGMEAFWGCKSLQEVTISEGITEIASSTFENCTSLEKIDLPQSVTKIGTRAFISSGLKSIKIPEAVKEIGVGAFSNCVNLKEVHISEGITEITSSTFENCTSLEKIDLPQSITKIGEAAFLRCPLKSISIPVSVTTIEKNAFYYCIGLRWAEFASIESICNIDFENIFANPLFYADLMINGAEVTNLVIPNTVNSIGNYAFNRCKSLNTLVIPDTVDKIGNEAFGECINIKDIYSESKKPISSDEEIFDSTTYRNATLWVPEEAISIYLRNSPWYNFYDIRPYDFTTGVTNIVCNTEPEYAYDYEKIPEIFTLNGVKVFEKLEDLTTGIYIIRQGKTTKKVVVK